MTCRQRGHRAKQSVALSVVHPPRPVTTPPSDHLAALEAAVARLDRLLNEADPRSAAALNKEYRETLRELESVHAEVAAIPKASSEIGTRRAFNPEVV